MLVWEQRKLKDITQRVEGNNGNMNLPVLTISAKQGWMTQSNRFSSVIAGAEKKKYTLLKKGNLSYNHGNSKIAPFGTVFMLKTYSEALVPKVYHSFKAKKDINPYFLEVYFQTRKMDPQLRKYISSSARMDGLLNITYSWFEQVRLFLPNIEEQNKLEKLFDILNKHIELQQRKLEQLKTIKQELIKRVFSNHNWETVRFKDIVQLNRGLTYHPSDITNNAGVRVLRSSNIQNSKLVYNHDDVFVKKNITDPQHSLRQYDILITAANGTVSLVGKHALYLYDDENQAGGFMILLHAKNPFFINCLLDSDWYKRQLARLITGGNGSIGNLKISDLQKTLVKIPKDSIQQSIGTTFYKLDQKIELKEKKVINLNNLKQFLLQNMFI
ncbi:MAG: restriction endonuclease subunit S [Lactobacillus paragasseri]|uniref:restriction endonuclease subunit S n=1 Tax=Lactobacillus paragasseri TaxID=2107999 RepID=UPI0022AC74A8|nr:restriction endonuclease subunit S [Lactobacillus paragasseri]MDU7064274.1 restriction endonuclease subunit S [Lactobacillus paragasseri]MDX5129974.1 restriction endonuclease subunit S [Lactobacillus paragasseri]MDX5133438.1 restriction endonuclease subunit S [Lactobacillus paragasseri]MDX5137389.1 restriction endonuclease subunit S [Lactobacillus paragasseri]